VGESLDQFEDWVNKKRINGQLLSASGRSAEAVHVIPVVVHILHQGEEYGEGSNVPNEQVFSQIEILNRDFRRKNADTTDTRPEFAPFGADAEIEFVLAKRDPSGSPTTGIVRARASKDAYAIGEEEELSRVSYWPPEQYLNVWVTNLRSGLLGFAQFPVSDLGGLNQYVSNKLLPDGVTVDYEYFGEGFNADDFSKGRTATHEIGHFLGLRHIWGDGGCGASDYCEDTPPMDGASSSAMCQLSRSTCGSLDMIENFMDYSPDVCMNIFTLDQRERMRAVLENSPRRASLLTSSALMAPALVANDLAITRIIEPTGGICSARFTPSIEIKNTGTNAVQEFEVRLLIDGTLSNSRRVQATVPSGGSYTVTFDEVVFQQGGLYQFTFDIVSVNGGVDGNGENDTEIVNSSYQRLAILPLLENFEGTSLQFVSKTDSPAGAFGEVSTAPKGTGTNLGMKFQNFGAPVEQFGAWQILLSPIIDLLKYPSITINFDYAYGHDGLTNSDGLLVVVSTDCGNTFTYDGLIFQRFGAGLATANIEAGEEYIPAGPADWRQVQLSLNGYRGEDKIQIAFIAQSGLGNNVYLDNLRISSNTLADYDIGITDLTGLPYLSCITSPRPSVYVRNFGNETIESFEVSYTIGDAIETLTIENISLFTGESMEVPLEQGQLSDGDYTVSVELTSPNGFSDQRPSDNSLESEFHIRSETDVLPLRETFDANRSANESTLYRINNGDERTWQIQDDSSFGAGNKVARMTSYDLDVLGDEFWLATRVLSLENTSQASMKFKLSYAKRTNRSERLRVMVSVDCGINFSDVVFDKRGSELAVTESDEFWTPSSASDWSTEFIDLTDYAGRRNVVVAIVATNGHGNNLYLDDVEFFLSSTPTAEITLEELIRVFPNPAKGEINVTFNLPERQTVILRMQDVRGKIVFEKEYPNTLNQTYQLSTVNENNGLYLIHVITGNDAAVQRVILRH